MDTFSYRVFLTIVQHHSFQKAAELHNVTPPAVSHIVKQMEIEFGFPLFVRNRHGVALTTAGESVLQAVSDIVQKEDGLYQLVYCIVQFCHGYGFQIAIVARVCYTIDAIF